MNAVAFEGVWKGYDLQAGRRTLFSALRLTTGASSSNNLFYALSDVSFEVRKGEAVGIIGNNGSGKSTILKLMAGITGPTAGTVTVDGKISSLIELGAGFHADLTGRENIYMNAATLGLPKKMIDSKFSHIVDFAELWDFIDVPVKKYSSGMYARLGFATAINVDPDILIVDEALAVGDISFAQKCIEHMLLFIGRKTLVIVSHNLADIKRLCNKVIVMDHGRILYMGPPEQAILEYYALLEKAHAQKPVSEGPRTSEQGSESSTVLLKQVRMFSCDEDTTRKETTGIEFGKPFEIELEFMIHATLNRPEFRISFNAIENNTLVCSSSSRRSLREPECPRGLLKAIFSFPQPLLYPRTYYINAAICDQGSGLYYYSEVDAYRINILYPKNPVFEDMEVGTGITHMKREFRLTLTGSDGG